MNTSFTLPLQYTLLKIMDRSAMAVASAVLYRFRLIQDTTKWFVMTNQQIAALTGLSDDTVIAAKKRLAAMGFIETSRGYRCCYFRVTQKALDTLVELCSEMKEKIQAATKAAASKIANTVRSTEQVRDLLVQFVVHTGKLPWRGYAQKWANTLAAAIKLASPEAVAAEFTPQDRSPGSVLARIRKKMGDKDKNAKSKAQKASNDSTKYDFVYDEASNGWVAIPVA